MTRQWCAAVSVTTSGDGNWQSDEERYSGLVALRRRFTVEDPAGAVLRLREEIAGDAGRPVNPFDMADLRVLLIEALIQCRRQDEAVVACPQAAAAAGSLRPLDWPRIITSLMVGADLGVLAGYPHAVTALDSVAHAFTYLKTPDRARELLVSALHAVAVFHHVDAAHGLDLLERVMRAGPVEGVLTQILTRGRAAMRCTLAGVQRPGLGVPLPMPGGMLRPRVDGASVRWLAGRVYAHPAYSPVVRSDG